MAKKLLFVINEAYFLLSHRLAIATLAKNAGWEIHVAAPIAHVWAPAGFSASEIEAQGFHFHAIPLSRRGKNPFVDMRTFAALWRLYRQLRPDLIHLVTMKPNLYGGLAARFARVPAVVFAVSGLGQIFVAVGPSAAVLRLLVTYLLQRSLQHPNCRVILQNPDDRNTLVGKNVVDAGATVVIRGSGVNLDLYKPAPLPRGRPVILLASRLIWEKGIGEFVAAARQLRDAGASARFVLVGDTHASNPRAVPRETLESWVREGVVEWWGFRADMATVLAQCAVVCLPSTYGEGVPRILLEAAASGRPIVTTNIPGCREAVLDGVNGYLVPVGNSSALEERLLALINDPGRRASFGTEGRRLVETQFDERTIANRTLKVYEELYEQS